ncbi:MAG: lipid A deacylase LpxR family protein [Nitrospinota bacterium]|nr:lipid A deacylase LpxR family protein [Nitrospinota bacterium]
MLAALLFFWPRSATADIVDDFWKTTRSGVSELRIFEDNDAFFPGSVSDKNYTNGTRLQFTFVGKAYVEDMDGNTYDLVDGGDGNAMIDLGGKPTRLVAGEKEGEVTARKGSLRFHAGKSGPSGGVQAQVSRTNMGFAVGQSIYTPSDTKTDKLLVDERPYAGWFYIGAFRETYTTHGAYYKSELDIGCIGPCAMAEKTQAWIHRYIAHSGRAQGWQNQISDELVVSLDGEYRQVFYEFPSGHEGEYRRFDLAYYVKGAVGNIFMDASGGIILRMGWFHTYFSGQGAAPPAATRAPSVEQLDSAIRRKWSLSRSLGRAREAESKEMYLFFRGEGRVVLYDAMLQGGMMSANEIHTVAPSRFIAAGEVGAAIHYKYLLLQYSVGFKSSEHIMDDWSPTRHVYGRFQFALLF